MSDRIEGASLFTPPDANAHLIIELKPVWAWFSSGDEGVRLLPALTGSAKVARIEFDGWAPQRMESFTIPSQGWRTTELPGCPWRESWWPDTNVRQTRSSR